MTSLTNLVNPSLSQTYDYDDLARLTSVTSASGNWTYAYDATGNRTQHTQGGAATGYVTASTSNRLGSMTGGTPRSYSYDAKGNTLGITGRSFVYDAFNRLRSASVGTTQVDYRLNALGQRVFKRVVNGSNVALSMYGYDPSGMPVYEYKEAQGVNQYVWLGGEPIAVLKMNAPYWFGLA
jgi:YD repeat-containing protein